MADFERFVDTVRETASRHLHTLVLVNADLRGELDILRSFFLLARGELFQNFIEEADALLKVPPNAATEYDIRQCFISTIRKLLRDDENLVGKIKVEMNMPKNTLANSKDMPKKTGWELLSLSYEVPWPLHLIISPKVRIESVVTFPESCLKVELNSILFFYS